MNSVINTQEVSNQQWKDKMGMWRGLSHHGTEKASGRQGKISSSSQEMAAVTVTFSAVIVSSNPLHQFSWEY